LWFTERDNNEIGRITPGGQVGLFTLPSTGYWPQNIIAGPDSRLWFTMRGPARVGAFAPFAPAPSPPDVQSLEPRFGPTTGGTKVLITGYNVGSATQVLFGDTPATSFTVVGPGQLLAVAPAHAAGQVDVTVVTPSGTTATGTASHFFYPSPECGRVISQSTTLDHDIGPCYGDGVRIGADNVTLDLNGKRIYGFADPSDGNAAGVGLSNRSGVQVKNGTVSGFDAGVVISGGASNTLTGLTVKDNIGPDTVETTLGDGIFIEASASNKVVGNTISNNGIFDGIGIYEPQSNSNVVESNVIEDTKGPSDGGPAGQGIIINGATEGATPTHLESTRVAGNVVRGSASAGIANVNHVRGSIVGNTVTGNGATNSVGNGIGVSVGFIWRGPIGMLIQGNNVHGNGVDGIRIAAKATGNRIFENDAADNNKNPAANRYEGSPPAFDLHDLNVRCAGNAWQGNIWGSGGFSPACTANGGSGPTVAAKSARTASSPSGRHAKAWERFLNRGR
ncbi:MAG: right-handed parallel beta-helix repeat-containing protein, partial [Actinobacteria bacterium]|nr:right-handed parallel beta-helix repeat-containing protein [Actinomycetota bacterium]